MFLQNITKVKFSKSSSNSVYDCNIFKNGKNKIYQLSVLLYFEELTLTQMGIISYSKGQVQENLFYYLESHDNAYLLHNNLKKLISIP